MYYVIIAISITGGRAEVDFLKWGYSAVTAQLQKLCYIIYIVYTAQLQNKIA